ncbi:hypothetical protein NE237_009684 [Protea cynaroides]|uniref:Uncharacterized protein n=1 Tax=Protea cynaroides TaxID=273540 RepID=A0A9Q0KYE3_9MAGN|nr:hypothetical protein NE237_009684 [Protea cynaroides]
MEAAGVFFTGMDPVRGTAVPSSKGGGKGPEMVVPSPVECGRREVGLRWLETSRWSHSMGADLRESGRRFCASSFGSKPTETIRPGLEMQSMGAAMVFAAVMHVMLSHVGGTCEADRSPSLVAVGAPEYPVGKVAESALSFGVAEVQTLLCSVDGGAVIGGSSELIAGEPTSSAMMNLQQGMFFQPVLSILWFNIKNSYHYVDPLGEKLEFAQLASMMSDFADAFSIYEGCCFSSDFHDTIYGFRNENM